MKVTGRHSRFMWAVAIALVTAAAAPGETVPAALGQARKGVVTVCATGSTLRRSGPVGFFQEETEGSNILGSGIVLSGDGVILTAYHAVSGISELSAVLWDLTELKATLVAAEPGLDIALLRVQSVDLAPIPWRKAPPPSPGEIVFAIGTPGVFPNDLTSSVSRGVISSLHRSLDVSGDPEAQFMADLIETDAQLSPGESGGALVDEQGRLVGMCLAVYHPTGAIRGRAFALAADDWLRKGIDSMLLGGGFPLGRLGVHIGSFSLESTRRLGVAPQYRIHVSAVDRGGPAEVAGLTRGDIITHVNGQEVRSPSEFRRLEMRLVPKTAAKVAILRGKPPKPFELALVVAEQEPPERGKPVEFGWRGMRLRDIDEGLRREMSIPNKTGVAVVGIERPGNAFVAGLRLGDVISEVNNTPVDTLAQFEAAVKNISASNVVRVKTGEGIGHIQGDDGRE